MTERKFTDEEVIKALECCSQPYCNNNKCPLNEHTINTKDCITKLSTNSLDLINRQRAEIERLRKYYFTHDYHECHNEAIKEFAERLKAQKIKPEFPWEDFVVTESAIDELLKKMMEENQ